MPVICDRCPFGECTNEAQFLFKSIDYNRRVTTVPFNYYKCLHCRQIFLNNIPDNLSQYYEADYYVLPKTAEELRAPATMYESFKVDIIKKFKSSGRVLDVGPGAGGFLLLMKEAGFEATAIEMDEAVCRFIQDEIGIEAVQSDTPGEAVKQMGLFDIITLWQVIEHLPDPWGALRGLADHLAPGGILVIAAPNPNSIQFRFFRHFWAHLDAPRHIQFISSKLIQQQLASQYMKRVLNTSRDEGTLYWNKFGHARSLEHVRLERFGILKRLAIKVAVRGLRLLERAGLPGTCYTLVLQKRLTTASLFGYNRFYELCKAKRSV